MRRASSRIRAEVERNCIEQPSGRGLVDAFFAGMSNSWSATLFRGHNPVTLNAAVNAALDQVGEYGEGYGVGLGVAMAQHDQRAEATGHTPTTTTTMIGNGTQFLGGGNLGSVLTGYEGLSFSAGEPPRYNTDGRLIVMAQSTPVPDTSTSYRHASSPNQQATHSYRTDSHGGGKPARRAGKTLEIEGRGKEQRSQLQPQPSGGAGFSVPPATKDGDMCFYCHQLGHHSHECDFKRADLEEDSPIVDQKGDGNNSSAAGTGNARRASILIQDGRKVGMARLARQERESAETTQTGGVENPQLHVHFVDDRDVVMTRDGDPGAHFEAVGVPTDVSGTDSQTKVTRDMEQQVDELLAAAQASVHSETKAEDSALPTRLSGDTTAVMTRQLQPNNEEAGASPTEVTAAFAEETERRDEDTTRVLRVRAVQERRAVAEAEGIAIRQRKAEKRQERTKRRDERRSAKMDAVGLPITAEAIATVTSTRAGTQTEKVLAPGVTAEADVVMPEPDRPFREAMQWSARAVEATGELRSRQHTLERGLVQLAEVEAAGGTTGRTSRWWSGWRE
ncbi:unnamed protein product [Phytophthora fragariaefolia]|uniref:Unnamed protein product n=1 Tax=Phytophthora fragariaefolia TaxID=1490495 RepID=A0A9W6Y2K6_9STRA|nr:unnamed protein product [Phytophthora fragariaefolia]